MPLLCPTIQLKLNLVPCMLTSTAIRIGQLTNQSIKQPIYEADMRTVISPLSFEVKLTFRFTKEWPLPAISYLFFPSTAMHPSREVWWRFGRVDDFHPDGR